jgi:hypothetical protein
MFSFIIMSAFQILDELLNNAFIGNFLKLGLVMYVRDAAPMLPSDVSLLFDNVLFKIFISFMVLYVFSRDVVISFVVASAFILLLNKKENYVSSHIEAINKFEHPAPTDMPPFPNEYSWPPIY